MPDEPKGPPEAPGPSPSPTEPSQPAAPTPKPAAPAGQAAATPSKPGAPAAAGPAGTGGATGGGPGALPKPAAPKAPPPAPKPAAKPDPWSSPLVEELQKRFPGVISDPLVFRNQPFMTVARESIVAVSEFLKSDEGGGYTLLTDETAVDYPKREKRFEIIYQLYSFKLNHRLRLKVLVAEGEKVPSVTCVWPTANWLEREVYDMFGVEYEGHPDLKRILLPDGWVGHPLRKDYDILKQDDAWVQENLHIKSGQ
jgi:NADH-quinone oxidoreductase subunit C